MTAVVLAVLAGFSLSHAPGYLTGSQSNEELNAKKTTQDSTGRKRPWIIQNDPHQTRDNATHCFRVTDFAAPVVRISLARFMERKEGPGHPFLSLYQYIRSRYDRTHWLPSIGFDVMGFGRIQGIQGCRAYAIHNYKVGGTTLRDSNKSSVPLFHRHYRMHIPSILAGQDDTAADATTPPDNQQPTFVIPVFSFLRDPVAKFVSGIGQVLKMNRCEDCHRCIHKNDPVPEKNIVTFMTCILDQMERNASYLDRHLSPQLFTLYRALQGIDIYVELMNVDQVENVLVGLGAARNVSRHQDDAPSKDTGIGQNTALTVLNQQTKAERGYDLTGGVSKLTPDIIRRICRFYEMDVILLRETQLVETICDYPDGMALPFNTKQI